MRSQPVSLVHPVGLFVVWLGSITDNQMDQIDPKTKQTSVLISPSGAAAASHPIQRECVVSCL
jgi:hypothetical protein